MIFFFRACRFKNTILQKKKVFTIMWCVCRPDPTIKRHTSITSQMSNRKTVHDLPHDKHDDEIVRGREQQCIDGPTRSCLCCAKELSIKAFRGANLICTTCNATLQEEKETRDSEYLVLHRGRWA